MLDNAHSWIPRQSTAGYKRALAEWQSRAVIATAKRIGYVNGRIEHNYHGAKKNRFYQQRWEILIKHGYDPYEHTHYDDQGVLQLRGKPALEAEISAYNRSRREDATDD
jgi:hypothetical protein